MKNFKFLLLGLSLMMTIQLAAQTNTEMPLLSVYVEEVKPAAHMDYLRTTKEWVSTLTKEGMNAPAWNTFSSGFSYYYVMPIKSMADFDKDPWEGVEKKLGAEKFKSLMSQFDPQITSNHHYVIKMDNKLSYLPEGTTADGQDYREFIYLYVKPENMDKAKNLAGMIKDLFERKNSKFPYATYQSGIGAKGPYFMVAQWAKNPMEFEKMRLANNELLGQEFLNMYNKMLGYCSKVEFKEGLYHPNFSNPIPSNATTVNSN